MTRAELTLYFQAWNESRAEVERLSALDPDWRVNMALERARADEEYDRMLYLRMRAQYKRGAA